MPPTCRLYPGLRVQRLSMQMFQTIIPNFIFLVIWPPTRQLYLGVRQQRPSMEVTIFISNLIFLVIWTLLLRVL